MKKSLMAILAVAAGCSAPGRGYTRGSTEYAPGKAVVVQPNLTHSPDRNFEGLRVAGSDTDVVPAFWERELALSGQVRTFELFKMRCQDLEVYQAGAREAALRSFREFCAARNILTPFDAFWGRPQGR